MVARHAPERWPGMDWNGGPACAGMVARHGLEPALSRELWREFLV